MLIAFQVYLTVSIKAPLLFACFWTNNWLSAFDNLQRNCSYRWKPNAMTTLFCTFNRITEKNMCWKKGIGSTSHILHVEVEERTARIRTYFLEALELKHMFSMPLGTAFDILLHHELEKAEPHTENSPCIGITNSLYIFLFWPAEI